MRRGDLDESLQRQRRWEGTSRQRSNGLMALDGQGDYCARDPVMQWSFQISARVRLGGISASDGSVLQNVLEKSDGLAAESYTQLCKNPVSSIPGIVHVLDFPFSLFFLLRSPSQCYPLYPFCFCSSIYYVCILLSYLEGEIMAGAGRRFWGFWSFGLEVSSCFSRIFHFLVRMRILYRGYLFYIHWEWGDFK